MDYFGKAGGQALHSGAYKEAVDLLTQALALDGQRQARPAGHTDSVRRATWD